MRSVYKYAFVILTLILSGCDNGESGNGCRTAGFADHVTPRNFSMGFTTWPFGLEAAEVQSTYDFIDTNGDIYSEQIDGQIPWGAWINNTPLPESFTSSIDYKVASRLDKKLLLSVSLFNAERNDLARDVGGNRQNYQSLNDEFLRDAYVKHLRYLVDRLSPDYLVFAMEVNEYQRNMISQWDEYQQLAAFVRSELRASHPDLKIAESFTLHNWYKTEFASDPWLLQEMKEYIALSDFTAISYYPFLQGLHKREEFDAAFIFLNEQAPKPVAIVETGHLAENLSVPELNVSIEGTACEQNQYLESLLRSAHTQDFEFVIWWTHRDYDALLETFPVEQRVLGKLWRDTGLLNESGEERLSFNTWSLVKNRD